MLIAAQGINAQSDNRIWRVNNTAGVNRDAATIMEVLNHPDFTAGDTIHLEGSVSPYSENVVITQRVVIHGPGYHLSVNPETQHLKPSARVTNITFNEGSAGSVLAGIEQVEHTAQLVLSAAAGATSVGISVGIAAWTGPRLIINESNITIQNCKLNWVDILNDRPLSDINIRRNWFSPGLVRTTASQPVSNLSLINNFFRNDHGTSGHIVIDLDANAAARIQNNTFYGGFQINAREHCLIYNNVFYMIHGRTPARLTTHSSNAYVGNISNIGGLGGMVNGQNLNTIRESEVSEAAAPVWFTALGGIAFFDRYFRANFSSSSPIRQAAAVAFPGTTGSELGMFYGLAPYVLSGLTNIPSVYEIVMPMEVSSEGFEVTVRVRAN
jgi:hypothetical protein